MASSNAPRKRISKSASSKTTTKRKTSSSKKSNPMRREVKIFILSFISLVIILSYYTRIFGVFGRFVRNVGLSVFGAPGYAIPVFITAIFIHKSIKKTLKPYTKVYLSFAGIAFLLSCFLTVSASNGDTHYLSSDSVFSTLLLLIEGGKDLTDGGILGACGIGVMALFGYIGSKILFIFLMAVLFAVATNFVPIIALFAAFRKIAAVVSEKIEERKTGEEEDDFGSEYIEEIPSEKESVLTKAKKKVKGALIQTEIDFDAVEKAEKEKPKKVEKPKKIRKKEVQEAKKDIEPEKASSSDDSLSEMNINIFIPSSDEDNSFDENSKIVTQNEPNVEIVTPDSAVTVPQKKEPNVAIEIKDDEFITETAPYVFPPVTLLNRNTSRASKDGGSDLRELAKTLIETLRSFGVEAKVLEVSRGPSVTRFEIQPSTGVKVSKIVNLADDIALNLAALSVRIEAPIPGKAAVGIEIPNGGNSIVRLREVIDCPEFVNFKEKTAFALGKDITGNPVIADISKMPHALIAGATGSGKSVCINALITSILYKADPSEVKFIMIDPKVVELSVYNGIPHLLIPVVTDPRKAAGALNWAVQEMTKRYKMFAESNVRDIKGYNELAKLNGEKTLEKIIIIVDELADLMMVAPRDVEDAICRLAQLARAAGMHLVVATQRPSVDVVTGLIKANVPTRIAFAVSSQIDSRTILDMGGAEKLLGKGDMLFLPMGASKPTRIQGAFIDDSEVNKIVEFVKQPDVKYDEDVMEKIESGVTGEKDDDPGDADELLPKAIEIVVEAGQASASLLQRRLKVGYSRAGRLIDQLEERGIIGPHEGAKPRSVLISRAEYAEMTMQE
jgi:S-DNA-T family DNA segregation ATPase FtsK/SpoIIIE